MAQAEQAIFEFDPPAVPNEAQVEKLDKDRDVREKWEVESGEWKVKEKNHSSLPTSHSPLKEYAEVRPSGDKLGEPITLAEVLPHLKTFKLRQPYVYLVGGLVIHGKTEGDIDILIKDSEELPDEFRHVLEWRIMRSLPEKYWDRVQFHRDNFHGPFTDNTPLYDLTIERVNEDNQIFRMDADADDADLEKQEPRAALRELKGQAERSRAEDKIKLFRFFVPMKPVKGAFPEQRQSIEAFLDLFKDEDFPVHSTKKFDGANYEIHKSGDRVEFFSEDGEENTERFPSIAEPVRELPWRDLVLLAEVEMWRDGKHLPREAVTGYIHEKGEPDDSELVANVYDVVYAAGGPKDEGVDADAGDIHKLPFAEREKYLKALGIEQATMGVPDTKKKLNRVASLISHNLKELKKHTEELAAKPGSEGNVAKKANEPHSLEGRSDAQVKFHNSAVLAGIVIERIETKTKGTYNYRYGVSPGKHEPHEKDTAEFHGKTYLEAGKTFSTNTKAKPGDILEIEVETLNLVHHPNGTVSVSGWAPRVMGVLEDRKEPDTVEQAVASAKEGRVFQEKEINKEGETIYLDIQDVNIDEAFEKANYVGNKRRLSKYIVGKFPDDGKTIFDPMCGCSAILIEAAKRGYRVKGNDLSIVPYWYSKGVFEGAQLSEADIEKLINATPHDGWLMTGWKGMYPRPRPIRRYLDGLAKKARQWQGAKGWAAKAVVSRVLQTLYSDSISGYSTIHYESQDAVKRIIERSAKEVNGFIAEVSGKGKVTNNDAKAYEEKGNWIVEGYAATSDFDMQEDIITQDAIKGSAKDLVENSTVLHNHNPDESIGRVLQSKARKGGLFLKILISKTVPDIWQQVKEGVLNKFSVRGKILEARKEWVPRLKKYARLILKMRLMEVSLVAVPANPKARAINWYVEKALDEFEKAGGQIEEVESRELGVGSEELRFITHNSKLRTQNSNRPKGGLRMENEDVTVEEELLEASGEPDLSGEPDSTDTEGKANDYPYPKPNAQGGARMKQIISLVDKLIAGEKDENRKKILAQIKEIARGALSTYPKPSAKKEVESGELEVGSEDGSEADHSSLDKAGRKISGPRLARLKKLMEELRGFIEEVDASEQNDKKADAGKGDQDKLTEIEGLVNKIAKVLGISEKSDADKAPNLTETVQDLTKRLDALEGTPGERTSLDGQEGMPGEKNSKSLWKGLV